MSSLTSRLAHMFLVALALCSVTIADDAANPPGDGAATSPAEKTKTPLIGDEPWEIRFKANGWIPGLKGHAGVGRAVGKVDVSSLDAIDNIDLVESIVPINLEARYGRWGFLADLFYVRVEDQLKAGPTGGIKVNVEAEETILELGGFYRVGVCPLGPKYGNSVTLDVLGGARYNRLAGNIGLQARGRGISLDGTQEWWDPFVGPRVIWNANEKLSLFARGDVGGFGLDNCSHFAWQFMGGVNYNFTKNFFVEAGYRLLDTDYESGSGRRHFMYDVQMAGPYITLGVKF